MSKGGGDIHILTGLDAILNPENIKPGINLRELERQMVNGGFVQQKTKEPEDRFNEELIETAKKIGLSIDDIPLDKSTIKNIISNKAKASVYGNSQNYGHQPTLDSRSKNIYSGSHQSNTGYQSNNISKYNEPESNNGKDDSEDSDNSDGEDTNLDDHEYKPDEKSIMTDFSSQFSQPNKIIDNDLKLKTLEQERQSHIVNIIGANNVNANPLFENEKREDKKCAMLAEIDTLTAVLTDLGVDVSRVTNIDKDSDFTTIENARRYLLNKYDQARYCSFADEIILFGAYAMEDLFNGERTWFGKYKPDLRGWHNHVSTKLKRMRGDTATIISGAMEHYDIGPVARILLELVPNMLIYSHTRKQQHDEPDIYSEDEINLAKSRILNMVNQ